jgi:hypothetical protein
MVNTTAVRLRLGSGGYHIVVCKLDRTDEMDYHPSAWGHIVKMRYSPHQLTVPSVEEEESPFHGLFAVESETQTLQHTPVIIGELHSMLPIISLALQEMAKQRSTPLRAVYLMPDGASLPISISRHVYHLRKADVLAAAVTTGHAWGGDIEAINIYTGLLAAKHAAHADIIVSLLGPGVTGTATKLGFSGMQLVEVIHATAMLGGVPLFVPRISFSDERKRHAGISHHTLTILSHYTLLPVLVPFPVYADPKQAAWIEGQLAATSLSERHVILKQKSPDIKELLHLQKKYPIAIESMGRTLEMDPSPFQAAYCAAYTAAIIGAANVSGDASFDAAIPPVALAAYYADWLNRVT